MSKQKGGVKKGQQLGGVRTFEDLRQRSVIDEVTGCWHVRASMSRGSLSIYCPATGERLTLPGIIGILKTGKKTKKGYVYAPTCRNKGCGNPMHRQLMTTSSYWKLCRPELPIEHRKKIAETRRDKGLSRFSPELRNEILTSTEPYRELAKRLGFNPRSIQKIRRGEMWQVEATNSSVFNWRPAA